MTPPQPDPAALARIRRGLGLVLFLAGLLHGLATILPVLVFSGKLAIVVPRQAWREMFLAQILFLVMGPMLYLTLSFYQTKFFYYETLADYLIGFALFTLAISWTARLQMKGYLSLGWAFFPAALLCAYGLYIRSGRGIVKRAEASDKP